MPRRKNWRAAEAKLGVKNPKKQKLTNLTGDTGPINSTEFDLDVGDTDTLVNINLSLKNQIEQSELNQNELSEFNQLEQSELNQLELPKLNLKELSELNQLELTELNHRELTELNQLELTELNQLELPVLNQLELPVLNQLELPVLNQIVLSELNEISYNTYANETAHSSYKQTNILSNQSKNSYAKKDSTSMMPEQNYHDYKEKEVSKSVNFFNNHFLKFGTFDQYATKFDDQSRGNQCTCNCLVFLSLATLNFDQNTVDLDYILNLGDEIYRKHVQKLTLQGLFQCMLLNFDEIPVKIEIPKGIFTFKKQQILFGIALQYKELTGYLTLQEAIQNCIKQSNKFLIMIGAICSAVYYHNQIYYFFDSHSHSECTLNNPLDSSGKSILIGFADLHDLVSYLYAFYTSLKIDLDSQYEILSVCISCEDTGTDINKQMQNYFEDQKLRNTKQKKKNYQYLNSCDQENSVSTDNDDQAVLSKSKVNTKKNKTFREKERQRELNYKRTVRKDKDFRKAEAGSKKAQRDNFDLRKKERQREIDSKRKARENKDFRKAEAENKKSQRDNFEFRQKERQQQIDFKRKARINKDFRKTEAESKKCQRENFDLRQKETTRN
ncbi:unnamed protein product [Mytilus edulis]|uniref:Peptidase C76 domain-containing protein n=1 Tax=Mytilus edulis TaxID=6550 RepID=A0A8S3S982_MYTED|nr:unnamed protein product [Mytilus edulis]